MKQSLLLFFLLLQPWGVKAELIEIAPYFQSNMVLQQDKPITVWGKAPAGMVVRASFDGEAAFCTTGEEGKWELVFRPRKASFLPKELKVGDTVLQNILIGDVWICSGQSNMEMITSACDDETRDIEGYENIRILNYSGIRLTAKDGYTQDELARCNVDDYFRYQWEKATYGRLQRFSAVATHFGIRLYEKRNIPIGLVCCAVGGSAINNWIPEDTLKHYPFTRSLYESDWLSNDNVYVNHRKRCREAFKNVISENKAFIPGQLPYRFIAEPGFVYEASFARIGKVGLRGVLWYQGESDAYSEEAVANYESLFKLMVKCWRANFRNSDLPFVTIQLPEFDSPYWPEMRYVQDKLSRQISHVFLVPTVDLGDAKEIHYKGKKAVGVRAAQVVLKRII